VLCTVILYCGNVVHGVLLTASAEVPDRKPVREINLAIPGIDTCKPDQLFPNLVQFTCLSSSYNIICNIMAAAVDKPPEKRVEHVISLERTESDIFAAAPLPPPPPPPPPPPRPTPTPPPLSPPPPPPPPVERVIVNPIVRPEKRVSTPPRAGPSPPRAGPSTSATSFSVATLQQHTNSFGEGSLIRESRLGKVYLAEFPEGKVCTKYCFIYSVEFYAY
jgi:hypothetical protein